MGGVDVARTGALVFSVSAKSSVSVLTAVAVLSAFSGTADAGSPDA